jgi:hypothetical protein
MQDGSPNRRIMKIGSNGGVKLRTITMTADFGKQQRRSMTVNINRGETKVIGQ